MKSSEFHYDAVGTCMTEFVTYADTARFTRYGFTGKERDTESGNDYFGARYYASSMGRWLSPDDGSDFDPGSPQSWNLYSYVRNNPLNSVDEDGRQVTVCSFVKNADGSTGQTCNTISDDAYKAAVAAQQASKPVERLLPTCGHLRQQTPAQLV